MYEFDEMLGELRLNYSGPQPQTVPGSVSSFHSLRSHTLPSFAVITSDQRLSLYSTPTLASWHQLTLHRSLVLQGKGSSDIKAGSYAYGAVVWETSTSSVLVASQVSISGDGSRLYVNAFGVQLSNTTNAVNLVASAVIQPSQLPSFTAARRTSTVNITAAAIALTMDDVELTCPDSARYDVAGVLSFTTSDYDAYVAVVCLSLDGRLYVSPIVLLDAGSSPSLSIATSPSSAAQPAAAHVLLTLGDSYCYNNEPANKIAFSGLCDHTPTPLSDVLTYTYARLADIARFVQQVDSSNSSSSQPSVICSSLLLHGMYDMGSRTSVLLWTGRDGSGQDRLGVVELHVGRQGKQSAASVGDITVQDTGLGSNEVCGVAEPFDGLVIDAWQLPERTTWHN